MRKLILGILTLSLMLVMIGSVSAAPGPVISNIAVTPQYPICSSTVTVCADVTSIPGVSNVRLDCLSTYHGASSFSMIGSGRYCAGFSFTDIRDAESMSCSIIATDADGSNTALVPTFNYDCANPVVNAGPDQTVNEGTLVTFDSSGSHDGGSGIASYFWTFGDGQSSTEQNPTHTYLDNRTYTATLAVTDHVGNTNSDTVQITVNDLGPTAILLGDTNLYQGTLGHWDASSSTHGPDAIVSYEWDWNYDGSFDASGDTSSVQSHTYNSAGTYNVAVRVTDDDGSTSIAQLSVIVKNFVITNLPASKNDVVNQPFTFDVDAMETPSVPLTYSLVLGEFPAGMTINPTTGVIDWTPTTTGDYTARVSVNDGTSTIYGILTVNVYDYSIGLTTGDWNLISIPLVPENDDTSIADVFSQLGKNISSVWAYTYNGSENIWTYNELNSSGNWMRGNSLQNIIPGYGYYVKMNTNQTLYLNGKERYGGTSAIPPSLPSVPLAMDSWNLIGAYGLNDLPVNDALTTLTGLGFPYYDIIYDRYGVNPTNLIHTKGYWISMKQIPAMPDSTEYKATY